MDHHSDSAPASQDGSDSEREFVPDDAVELDPVYSERSGTPRSRGKGRGRGRGKGRRGRPPSNVNSSGRFVSTLNQKKRLHHAGVLYEVTDDEVDLTPSAAGDSKIDADGNLLGGRTFRVPTFTSEWRSVKTKRFMLTIDVAGAAKFPDSLYFFRRYPLIHRITCTQEEKDMLIAAGLLSADLKNRTVTMISARNCFRVVGAAIVENGRYVTDDYYEQDAIDAGHVAGEPAEIEPFDPEKDAQTAAPALLDVQGPGIDILTSPLRDLQAIQPEFYYVHEPRTVSHNSSLQSSFLGNSNISAFGGTGLQPHAKPWDPVSKRAKPPSHLTLEGWMFEYARNVLEVNVNLQKLREINIGAVQLNNSAEEDGFVDEYDDSEDEFEPMEVDTAVESAGEVALAKREGQRVPKDEDRDQGEREAPLVVKEEETVKQEPVDAGEVPATGETRSTGEKRNGTPSKHATETPAPEEKPNLKKRKVFIPLRGIYDPETNVPHVLDVTQPTTCTVKQLQSVPDLDIPPGVDISKKGLASFSIAFDTTRPAPELPIPGMWNFRAARAIPTELERSESE